MIWFVSKNLPLMVAWRTDYMRGKKENREICHKTFSAVPVREDGLLRSLWSWREVLTLFKVVRIGLAHGVVRGWESRITSRIKSWDSLLMYPMAARWCCPIGWPAASASGIDWGKWPYRWALKFWGRQRSPREYSLKRWGPRAEPWSIRGSQHRVHCEEEENPASLVFPERKRRKSSKEGVIRCIKCCQEVRLRWG